MLETETINYYQVEKLHNISKLNCHASMWQSLAYFLYFVSVCVGRQVNSCPDEYKIGLNLN